MYGKNYHPNHHHHLHSLSVKVVYIPIEAWWDGVKIARRGEAEHIGERMERKQGIQSGSLY